MVTFQKVGTKSERQTSSKTHTHTPTMASNAMSKAVKEKLGNSDAGHAPTKLCRVSQPRPVAIGRRPQPIKIRRPAVAD